jgi:hypothetical protein
MKRISSDPWEATESCRQVRGAGKQDHEYLLELLSETIIAGRR